jgi:hypothetical protein
VVVWTCSLSGILHIHKALIIVESMEPATRVRFPALPDFLRSNGSGTESTQRREDN